MKLYVARNEDGARGMSAKLKSGLGSRGLALSLATAMLAPGLVAGCGGNNQASAPPLDATRGQAPMQPSMQAQQGQRGQRGQGMSGKQKVVLLAGAALLYYMYKKRRDANNQALPAGAQYYQSKNGRIYYRDPRTKQAIWVTPPRQLSVPQNELQGLNLEGYQGYNNGSGGMGLDNVRGLIPTG
jgi:hypothetical protein